MTIKECIRADTEKWRALKLYRRRMVTEINSGWREFMATRSRYTELLTTLNRCDIPTLEPTGLCCPNCRVALPPVLNVNLKESAWLPAGLILRESEIENMGLDGADMIHYKCSKSAVAICITKREFDPTAA